MIPVLVKIYKLLINELSNQIESNFSTKGAMGDDDDEVGDDDKYFFLFLFFLTDMFLGQNR